MEIDRIIKMKDNKYKMIIDGETIITYDSVILDNNLLYCKNITNDMYNKINILTNYYDTYNRTIKYILKRRRSEKEIYNYLKKFKLNDNDNNKIIDKLKKLNLINDVEYCRAFINDKVYLSNHGLNKIKIDLLEQNVPIETIENELDNIDQEIINSRLNRLILKKITSNNKYSNFYLKQKLLSEMINLGYSKENIIQIINNNLPTDDEILVHEFEKNYNVLSKKYSGVELNSKIKNKLLSRGFELNKINELLQKK